MSCGVGTNRCLTRLRVSDFVDVQEVDTGGTSARWATAVHRQEVDEEPFALDVEAGVRVDSLLQKLDAVANVDDVRLARAGEEEMVDDEVIAPPDWLGADRAGSLCRVQRCPCDRVVLEERSVVAHGLDAHLAEQPCDVRGGRIVTW